MCTVSWLHRGDGYVLLCNRDELRSRKPASGPRVARQLGVSFIAPADGNYGGSWIGVNQFGLTLCLVNRYSDPREAVSREFTSRGLLLRDLLDCRSRDSVSERLAQSDLEQFRPFSLVALAVREPAMLLEWSGQDYLVAPDCESAMPLVSSSFKEPAVAELRRTIFARLASGSGKIDEQLLFQYHRSHEPARGPYSVCMHRPDAVTVSLSAIRVEPTRIEFLYHPQSPCLEITAQRVQLRRKVTSTATTRG